MSTIEMFYAPRPPPLSMPTSIGYCLKS
jgi:hypothetical protein